MSVIRLKATLLLVVSSSLPLLAQVSNEPPKQLPAPAVNWTQQQDQQNMLDQLGIQALRPGASGNESDANHANYDETKANPWPDYPDPLTLKNGEKVTTAAMWWNERRPQIVADFDSEIYGRVPANAPKVTWTVKTVDQESLGFNPVIASDLSGHVDNAAYPLIDVDIHMTLVLPAKAVGPVPVLVMFAHAGFPNPKEPSEAEFAKINQAWQALLIQQNPSLKEVFAQHPAWQPVKATPFQFPQLNEDGGLPSTWQLIAAGWGFALLDPASVQADNGAGLTRGVIGLVNHGQPRHPDDWGALRAWAWGASRALDYLDTNPAVDAKHVGIEGVSRYGKAALVTEAYDQRFAMGLIGSSGEGGVKPSRRVWGEQLENLTGGEYYWMAGNFMKYGAKTSRFGSRTAGDLPVDSPELIALCAPRLVFVSYGIPAKGDAKWLDHQGSFMATVDASRVYQLLGAHGLETQGDYHTAKMPAVNQGLLDGQLAWRQHDGGHTDAPNMKYFLEWADRFIGHQPGPR
jgi:hypothetical protein